MEWINILKCPITGEDLRLLTSDEIAMLNKKISDSRVRNADGSFVTKQLEKALINSS
jgi:uncharacterized protein YbaR (Trm112 family)